MATYASQPKQKKIPLHVDSVGQPAKIASCLREALTQEPRATKMARISLAFIVCIAVSTAAPLKVIILAGQSNSK